MKKFFLSVLLCFVSLISITAEELTGFYDVKFGSDQVTCIEKMLNLHGFNLSTTANNFSELTFMKKNAKLLDLLVTGVKFSFADNKMDIVSIYFAPTKSDIYINNVQNLSSFITQFNCVDLKDKQVGDNAYFFYTTAENHIIQVSVLPSVQEDNEYIFCTIEFFNSIDSLFRTVKN